MSRLDAVKEHMEVIGADGVHVGTVDKVQGDRIKLTKDDSSRDRHRYLPAGIVAEVEGNQVRLSATGANARLFEEQQAGGASIGGKSVNWSTLGIAAVALVGAAAAAGALQTRKTSGEGETKRSSRRDKKLERRLETDETMRLISSTKVEGTPVIGRDGAKLGTIRNFMVDKYSGQVAYAVLEFGGAFGLGTSNYPLPWDMLDYDTEKDGYVLDMTKDQLAGAPKYEANQEPDYDVGYRRRVLLFYRS